MKNTEAITNLWGGRCADKTPGCAPVRCQWVSLARPFARLLFRTALPSAVAILFLKPCSLLLCLFFGWYVLSMISHLLLHISNPNRRVNDHSHR